MLARDQHSSLVRTLVNYGHKFIISIRPRPEQTLAKPGASFQFLEVAGFVTSMLSDLLPKRPRLKLKDRLSAVKYCALLCKDFNKIWFIFHE